MDYLSKEAKEVLDYFNVDFFKEDNLQRRNKRNLKAGKEIKSTHAGSGFLVNNSPTKFDIAKSIVGGMKALEGLQLSQVPTEQRQLNYMASSLDQQGLNVAGAQKQAKEALATIITRLNDEVLPSLTSLYRTPLENLSKALRMWHNY